MSLEKMAITAFSDPKFSQKIDTFTVQINPESYKHSHNTEYTANDSTDTAGVTKKFYVQSPQEVSFSFYLDGTGIVAGVTNVATAIKNFKTLIYSYNGNIHSPNYVQLSWGAGFTFNCRLESLDIDYLLFKPDGTPLRAKLDVNFVEYLSPDEIVKRSQKNSPDMTHLRIVQAGDTLPQMCYTIYGDSKYYWAVAEFNGLDHFRQLQPGSSLLFPPLENA